MEHYGNNETFFFLWYIRKEKLIQINEIFRNSQNFKIFGLVFRKRFSKNSKFHTGTVILS